MSVLYQKMVLDWNAKLMWKEPEEYNDTNYVQRRNTKPIVQIESKVPVQLEREKKHGHNIVYTVQGCDFPAFEMMI